MIKRKILVADDEITILKTLKRVFFDNEDLEIITVENHSKAFEVLDEQVIDIVITDEKMPQMTGTDFLKIVKEKYPDTIRMILTGYIDANSAMKAINQGEVYRYLTKPWEENELKVVIYKALDYQQLQRKNREMIKVIKKQNAQLTDQSESLRKANKELEEFAYITSHQLKQPLHTINGFSQLIKKDLNSKKLSEIQEYLAYILDGVGRMEHLIEDLLFYSRLKYNEEETEIIKIEEIMGHIEKELYAPIQESSANIIYDKFQLPKIKADKDQIIQAYQQFEEVARIEKIDIEKMVKAYEEIVNYARSEMMEKDEIIDAQETVSELARKEAIKREDIHKQELKNLSDDKIIEKISDMQKELGLAYKMLSTHDGIKIEMSEQLFELERIMQTYNELMEMQREEQVFKDGVINAQEKVSELANEEMKKKDQQITEMKKQMGLQIEATEDNNTPTSKNVIDVGEFVLLEEEE